MDKKSILIEYYKLIKLKIKEKRFQAALDDISQLLYYFPDCDFGHYYKGVCNFALKKYKASLKNYAGAIKINPIYAKAYFNIGVSFFMLHQTDKALINIGKALILFSKAKEKNGKKRCIQALKYIESLKNE